jgi:hypothetical protein
MKAYPTLRLDWPHSKDIYERTHHKRIEFWHKTNYLHGLIVESVEIKKHNQKIDLSYNSYAQVKQKGWSLDSGICKITICKKTTSDEEVNAILENIKSVQKSMIYVDVVLRNLNTNNILQLNMITGGYKVEDSVFCLHFLAIKV